MSDAFDEFKDIIPIQKQNPNAQALYEYEKHYMELLAKHKEEIKFIEDLISQIRIEQDDFWTKTFINISKTLDEAHIDSDVKAIWLKHIEENMQRSFEMSMKIVDNYMVKNIEQFKSALRKKLNM